MQTCMQCRKIDKNYRLQSDVCEILLKGSKSN